MIIMCFMRKLIEVDSLMIGAISRDMMRESEDEGND
jgi:hypothetical protein